VSGRPSSLMVEEPIPPTNGRQIIAARTLFGHNCPGGKELLASLSSVERKREQQRSFCWQRVKVLLPGDSSPTRWVPTRVPEKRGAAVVLGCIGSL
jgi:hypothetical protein